MFGLHQDKMRKMLAHSVPPGYRRQRPPRRPKLEPLTGIIDLILKDDLGIPGKERHTAKRIFERLRDEHGFSGQYTIVKDYVRERRRQSGTHWRPWRVGPKAAGAARRGNCWSVTYAEDSDWRFGAAGLRPGSATRPDWGKRLFGPRKQSFRSPRSRGNCWSWSHRPGRPWVRPRRGRDWPLQPPTLPGPG